MKQKNSDISLVILTAGRSIRFGYPKLFIPFDEEHSFIEHILQMYSTIGCRKQVVVINDHTDKERLKKIKTNGFEEMRIIVNNDLEAGRFYSVQLALKAIDENGYVFLQDVDRPIISAKTLNTLAERKSSSGVVVPSFKEKNGHPVLLGPEVVDFLKEITERNKVLSDILKKYPRIRIPVEDEGVLININTHEDYEKYFEKKGI